MDAAEAGTLPLADEAEIRAALLRVLESRRFILGAEVECFEREFAAYVGVAHCIGVGSGFDALHLSLRAIGVGPGDEVVVPAHTFAATWMAVVQAGGTPVPADVDPATCNVDARSVEGALSPRTRVIVPVHLYGQPADMALLAELARSHGVDIVEDAAQAHGARYRASRVGSLGRAAAWSFYPTKNLGALGDAGAVTTDDDDLADTLRQLRNYGCTRKDHHEQAGWNSRLDELQAAVLRTRLCRLDALNARRQEIARRYLDGLAGGPVALPHVPEWADPVWHQFVVRTGQRGPLRARLKANGIRTAVHYARPPHLQPAFAAFGGRPLPVAERLADEVLSLPIRPELTDGAVSRVIDVLRSSDA